VNAVDVKTAAPLFCAGVTAYHGIEDCDLKAGQWIAVIGCGGLGHLGIQYAKYVGPPAQWASLTLEGLWD